MVLGSLDLLCNNVDVRRKGKSAQAYRPIEESSLMKRELKLGVCCESKSISSSCYSEANLVEGKVQQGFALYGGKSLPIRLGLFTLKVFL